MARRVPLSQPDHPDNPDALLSTLREIVLSGRWTQGEYASAFERRVAEVSGSIYAVATNSGTSALEAILDAVGLKEGDEVIVPSYTFIATVNAVLACGARPVFIDVDPYTFNMDLSSAATRLTDKTKAIVLVHQFGIPADGKAFALFAKKHNLKLIEDAACGLGSTFEGKALGTFGSAGLLSFHPRKILSTGEGGMVLTDDEPMAARSRMFGNHGRTADKANFFAERVGHNHRMSEFQAALGLWALERLSEAKDRRRELAVRYDQGFKTFDGVRTIQAPVRSEWNYQSYPIRIARGKRNHVIEELRKKGIESSPGPTPAHVHPFIVHMMQPPRLPQTESAYEETLLLPMFAALRNDDQEFVIQSIRTALG